MKKLLLISFLNISSLAHAQELVTPSLPQNTSNAIIMPLQESADTAKAEFPQMALPTVPIPLTNASSYIMDGIATEVASNQQRVYNMRIKSDQTSLADYLRIKYSFSLSTQKFVPTEIVKYGNIGVYNQPYFAKNVPSDITMTYGTQTLSMGQSYYLTSTASNVYTMKLTAGDVVSFTLSNQTDQYRIKVINPYGEIVFQAALDSYSGVITNAIPILASGTYKVKFEPLNNSAFSFNMTFLNANRTNLAALSSGDALSCSFYTNLRDYAKYAIDLVKGQKLTVTKAYNSDISFSLLNSRNAVVAKVQGLPMLYEAPVSGRYYLFIDNSKGWGGSYSGSISIN